MVLDKLRDIISTNLFARNSSDLIMAIPELDFFFFFGEIVRNSDTK